MSYQSTTDFVDDARMFVDNQPVSDVLKGSKLQEYIQVPNGPGYGRLAGKWVRKERHINAIEKNATSMPFENVAYSVWHICKHAWLERYKPSCQKPFTNPTGQNETLTTLPWEGLRRCKWQCAKNGKTA